MVENVSVNAIKGHRPEVNLTVERVDYPVWKNLGFAEHHYLTQEMHPACRCLLFSWNDQPVAIACVLNFPIKGRPFDMKMSRLVVHPDYQGLGLARKIMDFCGGVVQSLGPGYRLLIRTVHEKMGSMLAHNSNWDATSSNGKAEDLSKYNGAKRGGFKHPLARVSFCYTYVGDTITGYECLFQSTPTLRARKELLLMGPSLFGTED